MFLIQDCVSDSEFRRITQVDWENLVKDLSVGDLISGTVFTYLGSGGGVQFDFGAKFPGSLEPTEFLRERWLLSPAKLPTIGENIFGQIIHLNENRRCVKCIEVAAIQKHTTRSVELSTDDIVRKS